MPPRTRRSTRSRQQAQEIDEPQDGDDGALEPVGMEDSGIQEAPSRRSSRRAAAGGRSSRRAAASSRGSSRKSARKELSPEEKAARRAAIRNTFLTVLIILVVGGGGAAAYFGLKEEPRQVQVELNGEARNYLGTRADLARQFMNEARTFRSRMEKGINARQPDEAKTNLDAMVVLLRQPVLGAGATPNPEDPNIGDLQLAQSALEMLGEIEGYEAKIRKLKDDRRAQINFEGLKGQLARLGDAELDPLETAMRRFMENPVRPEEGSNPDLQARYQTMIEEIEAKLHGVTSERLSRLVTNTSKVVETINLETQKYIAQSQYGTALSLVDEAVRNFPQADLKLVRQKVLSAAEGGWGADRATAQNLYKDAVAAGVGAQIRAAKLSEAIKVLEHAIASYGKDVREIAGYVEEAERLLREYKGRL
jgi:hypothetical protein